MGEFWGLGKKKRQLKRMNEGEEKVKFRLGLPLIKSSDPDHLIPTPSMVLNKTQDFLRFDPKFLNQD